MWRGCRMRPRATRARSRFLLQPSRPQNNNSVGAHFAHFHVPFSCVWAYFAHFHVPFSRVWAYFAHFQPELLCKVGPNRETTPTFGPTSHTCTSPSPALRPTSHTSAPSPPHRTPSPPAPTPRACALPSLAFGPTLHTCTATYCAKSAQTRMGGGRKRADAERVSESTDAAARGGADAQGGRLRKPPATRQK